MITRIVIPQIFENMEEATIGEWLKNEGETVATGDLLCELITEKTTFQLEAEGEGILLRVGSSEKSIVPVGAIIGLIGEPGDELPDIEAENAALGNAAEGAASSGEPGLTVPGLTVPAIGVPSLSVPSLEVPAPSGNAPSGNAASDNAPSGGSRLRATPAARRVARELNVALEDVAARFPGKVLGEDDVRSFAG